jgi:glycosyltransferase involved in cell wall biosynthesis
MVEIFPRKNVLILSYYFPPYSKVGGTRTSKFCKYLPEFGWTPWIFTVDKRYYGNNVIKESNNDTKYQKIIRIPYAAFPGNKLFVKIFFPLIALFFIIFHRNALTAFFVSGSPFHPFPLTAIVTGIMSIPSILDFRDSWSINHGYDGRKATTLFSKIRHHFFRFLENIAIKFASSVVFCTPTLIEEYSQLFPQHKHKYNLITNGYDPDDFINITPTKITSKKAIILAGKIHAYTPEVLEYLIKTLRDFPDLHFIYIGHEKSTVDAVVRRYHAEKYVSSLPLQSYRKVINYIAAADITLLTNGVVNGLGTKIFDYLAVNKPIIAFVPGGSVIKKMFSGHDNFLIFESPHTEQAVYTALESVRDMALGTSTHDISQYSRKKKTKELSSILDLITN